MDYDNPAARLLAVLKAGKKIAPDKNCRQAWQELLDVTDNDTLLMSRMAKVMELCELTKQALNEVVGGNSAMSTHWTQRVNTAFMVQNVTGKWETFIGQIDHHTIDILELGGELLQARSNTKLIADESLRSLRDTLDGIATEILASEMSDELKKYLVRSLRNIILHLDEYKLTGALPLLQAIEATIGHAAGHPEYKSFLTKEHLGMRLAEALAAMANLVTVAVGMPQLTHAIALLTQ